MAQGGKIRITAAVDGVLRAYLHTGVAFPTHIGFDVKGATVGGIDVHNVGRTDIHAMAAAVATRHINKRRHDPNLTPVTTANDGLINNAGAAGGHYRNFQVCRRSPAGFFLNRSLVPPVFGEPRRACKTCARIWTTEQIQRAPS